MSERSAAADASAPGTSGGGRQERRKAETRRRLLAAARSVFTERGYDAARPQDIARAADVAVGTFYLHFADKREVFLAFTEEAADELMERVRERMHGAKGFEDRLYRSLEALADYSDACPGVVGAAFADADVIAAGLPSGASLRDRLALSLARDLRHGMQRGQIAQDYDAHLIAHGIVGLIQGASAHGTSAATPRREVFRNVTRFCARALAPTEEDGR